MGRQSRIPNDIDTSSVSPSIFIPPTFIPMRSSSAEEPAVPSVVQSLRIDSWWDLSSIRLLEWQGINASHGHQSTDAPQRSTSEQPWDRWKNAAIASLGIVVIGMTYSLVPLSWELWLESSNKALSADMFETCIRALALWNVITALVGIWVDKHWKELGFWSKFFVKLLAWMSYLPLFNLYDSIMGDEYSLTFHSILAPAFGNGVINVLAVRALSEWMVDYPRLTMAFSHLAFLVGITLITPLAVLIIYYDSDSDALITIAQVICVVSALFFLFMKRPSDDFNPIKEKVSATMISSSSQSSSLKVPLGRATTKSNLVSYAGSDLGYDLLTDQNFLFSCLAFGCLQAPGFVIFLTFGPWISEHFTKHGHKSTLEGASNFFYCALVISFLVQFMIGPVAQKLKWRGLFWSGTQNMLTILSLAQCIACFMLASSSTSFYGGALCILVLFITRFASPILAVWTNHQLFSGSNASLALYAQSSVVAVSCSSLALIYSQVLTTSKGKPFFWLFGVLSFFAFVFCIFMTRCETAFEKKLDEQRTAVFIDSDNLTKSHLMDDNDDTVGGVTGNDTITIAEQSPIRTSPAQALPDASPSRSPQRFIGRDADHRNILHGSIQPLFNISGCVHILKPFYYSVLKDENSWNFVREAYHQLPRIKLGTKVSNPEGQSLLATNDPRLVLVPWNQVPIFREIGEESVSYHEVGTAGSSGV